MRVQLKRIMCATDFSDLSNRAVQYGIALAKEFGAKLYMCHVIGLPSTVIYGEVLLDPVKQQNDSAKYAREQLGQLIGEQKVDWEPIITIGHVADELSSIAEEKDVDLAVSATHGRSGLKRLVLGSVTERLMRILPCPLLIVRSPESDVETPSARGFKLQKILIGCDFSPDSILALKHGLSLAQEFQSELYLAHVIEPPVYQDLLKTAAELGEEFQKDLHSRLSLKLENMVPEDARNWCTPKTVLLDGHPDEELTKYAVLNDIDLIVLGVRGRGLVEKFFVGSTTDRVVRRAPCPVLSVCYTVHGS